MSSICPHCGHDAQGGRVLCPKCGSKLHSAPTPRSGARRAASGLARGIGKLVRALVRLCITVAILGAVGLLFWPVEPTGETGAPGDAERVQAAVKYLDEAKGKEKPSTAKLAETHINSFLQQQVAQTSSTAGGIQLEGINVDIHPEDLVLNAGTAIGPIRLSWELTLVPEIRQDEFPFEITKARIGHLPMLGGLKQFAGSKVAGLFAQFDTEQEILKHLKEVKLADGGIALSVAQ